MLNPILDKQVFEKSKKEIEELCHRFDTNKDQYLQKSYKEEDVKVEFISPMFKALGWDVENRQCLSSNFKEVILQTNIKLDKKILGPDYSFQLYGERKFFLEVKAPYKDLEQDRIPSYQVRRYGWAANLDLVILTNFKEFVIYETKTKPLRNQPSNSSRVRYYKYTDYVDQWDEIYGIFSKEAIIKGFFDKFVSSEVPNVLL